MTPEQWARFSDPLTWYVFGIAPGAYILWLFYRQQVGRREPPSILSRTFLLMAPVLAVYMLGMSWWWPDGGPPVSDLEPGAAVFAAFGLAAIPEELLKLAVLVLSVRGSTYLRDPQSGLMFAAAAALGFASFENALYVIQHGHQVLLVRIPLATLGHVFFFAPVGYALGAWAAATLRKDNTSLLALKLGLGGALAVAIALHGLYDYFLMVRDTQIGRALLVWALSGAIALCLWVAALRLYPRHAIRAAMVRECPACGSANQLQETTCAACHVPMAVVVVAPLCSHCHQSVERPWRFCGHCGASLVRKPSSKHLIRINATVGGASPA
jgi:RsiW-degrading membrane proteinase PrsW (M82 family)